MNEKNKYLGYLKYSGALADQGLMDARKSAEALLGFDEIIRYFVVKDNPEFKNFEYEIPVRIKKSSWGIWVPLGLGIFAAPYLTSVAIKSGSNGLFETGPAKDLAKVYKYSIKASIWMIRIGLHLGTLAKKKIDDVKIKRVGIENYMLIKNSSSEILEVPQKYFNYFVEMPEKLFSKNSELVEVDRKLEIGLVGGDNSEYIEINENNKYIFYKENEDDGIVLPELEHGLSIELKGYITRATENTNSIGFLYSGHTITCKPQLGNIAMFKNMIVSNDDEHVFSAVKIIGKVDRADNDGGFKKKRPMILFSEIESLESDKVSLFSGGNK